MDVSSGVDKEGFGVVRETVGSGRVTCSCQPELPLPGVLVQVSGVALVGTSQDSDVPTGRDRWCVEGRTPDIPGRRGNWDESPSGPSPVPYVQGTEDQGRRRDVEGGRLGREESWT